MSARLVTRSRLYDPRGESSAIRLLPWCLDFAFTLLRIRFCRVGYLRVPSRHLALRASPEPQKNSQKKKERRKERPDHGGRVAAGIRTIFTTWWRCLRERGGGGIEEDGRVPLGS